MVNRQYEGSGRQMKFEVTVKFRKSDGSISKFDYSHLWTASSFAEAEKKSLEILSKGEFISKIEVDF